MGEKQDQWRPASGLAFSQSGPAQTFRIERQIVVTRHRRSFERIPDGKAWFERK
jgi:hypothetical protein